MYTQIDQGIRNLARLDVDNIADLYGLMNQLESKLAQAEYIGYQAQHAVTQAQGLYPAGLWGHACGRSSARSTCSGRRCGATAAQVAISTQAIRDAQARYQQQWADLIRAGQGGRGQRAGAANAGAGAGRDRPSTDGD